MSNDSKLSNNKIIFYDKKIGLKKLLNLTRDNQFKIFTFNYDSHKELLENKIKHCISDNELNENDYELIQEKSYYFTEWAANDNIKKKLTYKEINTGRLSQTEFNFELVSFLKQFLEIQKIFQKNSNAVFFASNDYFLIIKLFTTKTIILENVIEDNSQFLYDKIKIPIGFNPTGFTISKKNYELIKSIINNFLKIFLRERNYTNKEQIVFAEFDPIIYNQLFSTISEKFNINLYNRRRPYVWNLQSLKTIYNLNIDIFKQENIISSELKDIQKTQEQFIVNLEKMFDNETYFEKFFSIYEKSFWSIIKERFLQIYKKRICEAIYEIALCEEFFKRKSIKKLCVWSESGFNEQIIIHTAKKFGVKIYLFQHGLYNETSEAISYNKFNGVFPILSDIFLGWGKPTIDYVKQIIPLKNFIAVGNVNFDRIFSNKIIINDKNYILLTTTSPGKNISTDLKIANIKNYEENIRKICSIVNRINKKLIIKMHPDINDRDISKIINSQRNIVIKKFDNITSLIASCSLMITIDLSTTILEAQFLKKPVLSIKTKNHPFGTPELFKINACHSIEIDSLEMELKKIFNDSKYKEEIISAGINYVHNYISNVGNSSKKILKSFEL